MRFRNTAASAVALLMLASPTLAGQPNFGGAVIVTAVTDNTGAPVTSSNGFPVNCVSGCSGSSGASVGANGSAIPASSTQIGTKDASGNLQPASAANPVPTNDAAAIAAINSGVGTPGSAVPASGNIVGGQSNANYANLPISAATVAINISTATTTQLVALAAGKAIYVTSDMVISGGTGNFTWEYGTGTACATGTTVLSGAIPLTAQSGWDEGSGAGAVMIVPAGNALCALTSAGVQMSGKLTYSQF